MRFIAQILLTQNGPFVYNLAMTNADTATALRTARRALDLSDRELSNALLREDVREATPKAQHTCPQTGRLYTAEVDAWQNLYYRRESLKHIATFRTQLPDVAAMIEPALEAHQAALVAYETARKADKAAKQARREAKAAKAAEKALNPARPLASVNPVAAVNYDILSAAFVSRRFDYVQRCVEVAVRASGGRVCANVSASAVTEAAGADFDGYVAKLATKIDQRIVTAKLDGSLWVNSVLTVLTEGGVSQVWHTHCIVNYSCLGNAFNQWPTRRVS